MEARLSNYHLTIERIIKNKFTPFLLLMFIMLVSTAMHNKILREDIISIHSWRITQTQSTINNFYEEDFNILNPRKNDRGNGDGIFRMEFPLMQWLIAGVYKLTGRNDVIISRICSMLIGFASVLGMYFLIYFITRRKLPALIGMWAFNFSPSFYFYTVSPLPDNFALSMGIWGMAFLFKWLDDQKLISLIFSGFFLSLATLSKLPFILYFSVPMVFLLLRLKNKNFGMQDIWNTVILATFLVPPAFWYIWVIPGWSSDGILYGMMDSNISMFRFLDLLHHHLISALPELLINYGSLLFFVVSFYFIYRNKVYKHQLFVLFAVWGLALLTFFLFEINMIGKAHDYYLFPFLPVLFVLVGYGSEKLLSSKIAFLKILSFGLLISLPLFAWLRMQTRWNSDSPGFNRDLLTYKTELRTAVPKDALCIVGNDDSHFIFFYYADKKGWCFHKNELTRNSLELMVRNGAEYIFSDSREIEINPEINQFFDRLISVNGSIRVYSLKNYKSF